MTSGFAQVLHGAQTLTDQGRLMPALEMLQMARNVTQIHERRAVVTYNLGVTYWARLGDGVKAREEFLAAAADFDAHGHKGNQELRLLHANAIENAMLCALSFEEFEALAGRLRAILPDTRIVQGLLPEVRKAKDRGQSWAEMLLAIATPYWNNRDPKLDAGRYGEAKSTYHLMLANRSGLRLKRELWRLAVIGSVALGMRMTADCILARTRRGTAYDGHAPEEFLPIITDLMPLVDQYLTVNSGDEEVVKARQNMEKTAKDARQRWIEISTEVDFVHRTKQRHAGPPCVGAESVNEPQARDMLLQAMLQSLRGGDAIPAFPGTSGTSGHRHTLPEASSPSFGLYSAMRFSQSWRFRCLQCHKPLHNPHVSCPSCGTPTPVMGCLSMTAVAGAAGASITVWSALETLTVWLRLPAALLAGFAGLALGGSIGLAIALGRMMDRTPPRHDSTYDQDI